MLIPDSFDIATLEHLYATMPEEQLHKALDAGAFDLVKGGAHLHPQKVLVHGKRGPYYAMRMVSDAQADAPRETAQPKEAEKHSAHTTEADIKKYLGRPLTEVYAEEGKKGVMRALGAQYAEKGKDTPSYRMDRLEEYYGQSDDYTPEAAARAMQIWTSEKLRVPETEGMDEEDLEIWYDDLPVEDFLAFDEDGMMWGCSLIRQKADGKISETSESEVTASVCSDVLKNVLDNKGKVYPGAIYRGVVMPEGTIESLTMGEKVDLGGISSFTRSDAIALQFIQRSPIWDGSYESEAFEKIVYVMEDTKSYKVEQSQFANEQEHLINGTKPYNVSKIMIDGLDGPNLFEMDEDDEEEYDPYDDHVYYVYLEETK